MKKIEHLIGHIFTKKNIKIFVSLFIVLWFFFGCSFAQSSSVASTMSPVQKISYLIHVFISIMSWGRVVLATLAGKLMTNTFVYGTFLNLDKALWDLWNVMKNFANFILWFVLVFSILKNVISVPKNNSDPLKNSMKTVWKVMIAGVLVQMSWFLFWALLDISTIAASAIGSLPSQFMGSNAGSEFQRNMTNLLTNANKKVVVDFSSGTNLIDSVGMDSIGVDDVNKILDTVTPSSESMVWPLIFLWASVFNLYDLTDSSKYSSNSDDWWDLFLQLWINWFVMFAFSLMLALMFIFNLFRVITLWIVIPLLPLIVVISVFNKDWKSLKLENFLWEVTNIGNIIKLVFKPVYIILVLDIVLIVMVMAKTLVDRNGGELDLQEQNNITVESEKTWSIYTSSLDVANIAKINMTMKESLVDIFIYILGLVLMVFLMKSCITSKTGIKFIDTAMDNLSQGLWWWKGEFGGLLWHTGVIPTNFRDKDGNQIKLWIWTVANELKEWRMFDESIRNRLWIDTYTQDAAMERFLKISTGSFTSLNTIATSWSNDRKDRWLAEAVQIWKSKYSDLNKLWWDKEFRSAFDYYNEKNNNKIIDDDVENEWKGTRTKTHNIWDAEWQPQEDS